jgi:GNAT superfamily N-acetyltransferase
MELVWLNKSHLPEIFRLFQTCFNANTITEQFFLWKYFENPDGDAILCGVFDDQRLIASAALLPENIFLPNEKKKLLKFTDLMTDPAYRGKGLAKKIVQQMTEKGLQETKVIYTICSKIATKSFLHAGWNKQDAMLYFFRIPIFPLIRNFHNPELHTDKLNYVIDHLILPYSEEESFCLKQRLYWRTQNPKFNYAIITLQLNGISHFILFSTHLKTYQIVCYSEYSDSKTLEILFRKLHFISYKSRKYVVSLQPKKNHSYFFFLSKGYLFNLFSFGKMKSILDLNFIVSGRENLHLNYYLTNKISSINYDDL